MSCNYNLISPKQFYERVKESLGSAIGINAVYSLIKVPGFPSVRIGGRYYVIEEEISNWLESMSRSKKK